MKRYLAMIGAAMFFIVCFSLYLMMESVSSGRGYDELGIHDVVDVEGKIKSIESELQKNRQTISRIKDTVKSLVDGDQQSLNKLLNILREDGVQGIPPEQHGLVDNVHQIPPGVFSVSKGNRSIVSLPPDICNFANTAVPKADIEIFDVYNNEPFDDIDGGVWKQGFKISYTSNDFADQKLKVFVVPHSHDDPGWIKTFDRYYSEQTRSIFENMLEKLEAYEHMRFIYAEMSFFSKWWEEITEDKRARVKRLAAQKRLEFVTGGWVMPDEANSHYFAIVDQLIEGNQWLLDNVGVKPVSGWAIDPFGHSPTNAYILKRSGIQNMLIQRTHYIMKKYLAKHKQLEFKWRQGWDHSGNTDMFCHMMPFYSYDVPHTCGPDPKVCCQFDFKRLPGGRISCPWKVPPIPITPSNVADKAATLLDQYKQKAVLYKNNVVLVPLGDDFRYDKSVEWDQQYNNYIQLFNYINSNPSMQAEVKFGTLSDYFDALHERAGSSENHLPSSYPTLVGDFFSYADRADHYWTGYFTSRPFYKRLDRILEHHLRAAEILFSMAVVHARQASASAFPETQCRSHLSEARRSLGLFQHHDAITGTAKDFVVVDYANKLLSALKNMKRIIIDSAQFLLTKHNPSSYSYSQSSPLFNVDETRDTHDSLPYITVTQLNSEPKPIVFYNSLTHERTSIVRIYTDNPHVEVRDPLGKVIPSQVDPFWLTNMDIAPAKFKVSFVVTVPALGLATYSVKSVTPASNSLNFIPKITFFNHPSQTPKSHSPFSFEKGTGTDFTLENAEVTATLDTATGMLQHVTVKTSQKHVAARLEFLTYGVTRNKEKSGAYLFLPDGPAKTLSYSAPFIRVIEGPVTSEAHVFIPHVDHKLILHNSPGIDGMGLDIMNLVDIRSESNFELVMRINSDIKDPDNSFFTDLNGFQYIHRMTHSKLPMQANFYPMPTMAYLDDGVKRLSILTAQSLGVASLQPGWLEVVQDRRLNQDDNRGLGQPVIDNKRTPNRFRLLVEERDAGVTGPPQQSAGYASLLSQLSSHDLIYPLHTLPAASSAPTYTIAPAYSPLASKQLPCDVHMVNLKTLKASSEETNTCPTAMILRRMGVDCSLPTRGVTCPTQSQQVTLASLFAEMRVKEAHLSTLSFIHESQDSLSLDAPLNLPAMELQAVKLHLS